jgi:hypothetical protein
MESVGQMLAQLWTIIVNQVQVLWLLLVLVFGVFTRWPLIILWILWWLLAVNWKKMWPVLAMGAWLPLILVVILAAFVWSRIEPGPGNFLGLVTIESFWWQLGNLAFLVALALFCGYLQGLLHWTPPEIDLEPAPVPAHEHH